MLPKIMDWEIILRTLGDALTNMSILLTPTGTDMVITKERESPKDLNFSINTEWYIDLSISKFLPLYANLFVEKNMHALSQPMVGYIRTALHFAGSTLSFVQKQHKQFTFFLRSASSEEACTSYATIIQLFEQQSSA
jgi:hypothetical protein